MLFIQGTIIFGTIALIVWGVDALYNKYAKSKVDDLKNMSELMRKGEKYLNTLYECKNEDCGVYFRTHQLVLYERVKGKTCCPHCETPIDVDIQHNDLDSVEDYERLQDSLNNSKTVSKIKSKKIIEGIKYHPSCPYVEGAKNIESHLKMLSKLQRNNEEKELNDIWESYNKKVEGKSKWVSNLQETTNNEVINNSQKIIDSFDKPSVKEEIKIEEKIK